jgi:TATA-binding protein-associated factor Taf7
VELLFVLQPVDMGEYQFVEVVWLEWLKDYVFVLWTNQLLFAAILVALPFI